MPYEDEKVFEKVKQTHFLIEVVRLPKCLKITCMLFTSKALKFFLNITVITMILFHFVLKGLSAMNQ